MESMEPEELVLLGFHLPLHWPENRLSAIPDSNLIPCLIPPHGAAFLVAGFLVAQSI